MIRRLTIGVVTFFVLVFAAPLAVHASLTSLRGWPDSWRAADWSSAGILPPAAETRDATVRIYAAPTGRWKGIFAVHSWIVVKREGQASYDRYEVVGWGRPVRKNAYAPDGRWYSGTPRLVYRLDGPRAAAAIPKIEAAVADYRYSYPGSYRIWPGPNSNSFVAAIIRAVPELDARMPPNALGRHFPASGEGLLSRTPSGTGFALNLGGFAGLTVGWVEGFEMHLAGLAAGIDVRRPAIVLPGFGRIGRSLVPGGEV